MRDRGTRRKSDFIHAIRKKKKSDYEVHGTLAPEDRPTPTALFDGTVHTESWYNNLHQYSKNKIHCSCPMCNAKSGATNSIHDYRASDRRKFARMNPKLNDEDLEASVS